jgi:protein-S-isoprenylcysteine O-methyltransferase Ste14
MPSLWLAAYLLLYAALHSLLASEAVKSWAARRMGESARRGYRLFYTAIATLTLLPLPFFLYFLPDQVLYSIPPPWQWLLWCGQALAAWGMMQCLRQTDMAQFLGFSPAAAAPPALIVTGWYAYMRHPMYSFGFLAMWLSPWMSLNLATVFGIFTLYAIIGSVHEEARLAREFGAEYLAYQRRVGRFIPAGTSR